MKKIIKIFYAIAFSFCTIFLCIGYAAISDHLNINGTVEAITPKGVYIVNASVNNSATTSGVSATLNSFTQTLINTKVVLTSSTSSKATFDVTVYNIENETYAFSAVKYSEEFYDNTNITYELINLKRGDEITAKSYLTFQVSFSYKDKNVNNSTLNSILNFEFVPADELPEEDEIAVSGVLGRFKEILDHSLDSQTLINQMEAYNNNDRYNDSYIGNVVGSSEADQKVLSELFVGNLYLNINGVDTNVTVLIKRENVDGNTSTGDENGNEMTIYMTTDNLERDSFFNAGTAPVYAGVYTKYSQDGEWEQIGPMFEGTATVKGYDGNIFGEGSFDTDTWKSTNANGQTANLTIENIVKLYI